MFLEWHDFDHVLRLKHIFKIRCLILINIFFPETFNDLTMGVWMSRPFEVVPNQKGGKNLLFFNYVYRKEASFKTSINWVCNQNVVSRCQARIVQKTVSGELKLGKHGHNHDPVKT